MTSIGSARGRPLLVIAHPGHELRLYGWLKLSNPLIAIVTDGSGSTGSSRIDLSEQVVAQTGGEIAVRGRFAEPELYALMMQGRTQALIEFADELADLIDREGISQIVCDAAEGYHPAHDLCLRLTQTAVTLCKRPSSSPIEHYEYRVIGDPRPDPKDDGSLMIELDAETLRHKIDCSRRYASESGAVLTQEVQYMFDTFGEESFRHEVFRRAGAEQSRLYEGLRYYELRGEQQVKSGRYEKVLRYSEHMAPIEAALSAHAID